VRPRVSVIGLLALVVALGLAACGSSSSSSSSAAAAGSSTGPTDAQLQARVNAAKCMRAHGVDVPDSAATGTGAAAAAVAQLLSKYSRTQLQNAATACRSSLVAAIPALNLSASQVAQREREALAFVQCLRAHGINLPDPVASGLRVGIVKALSNVDTASPAFQKANTACASLRPTRLAPG
jgi:hypothetical protein